MSDDAGQESVFDRRLREHRQERQSETTRRNQNVRWLLQRRRTFFEPVYRLLDQMRAAQVLFPAGAPPSGAYVRALVEGSDGGPRVTIPVDTARQIEIDLAEQDGELAFKAGVWSNGWSSQRRVEDYVLTKDVSELAAWLADVVCLYEQGTPSSPANRRPPQDEGSPEVTAGRLRRIEFE